ncbi:MAG: 30S ribosomal protein S8 [Candidatus Korarchaeota archaeon]|nr:30S ribosomal protein S8 [Thermoproteota archaeon]MCR8455118.1 30S ribosomal protein S8 [Thermoproteota archaeon]MCR8462832.1 30S ribosomal protein S8 [Thermoproteota archaeon]MCR8471119.1 30S ribosomal protein S8 [Thermoproteota archaeon]MCR8472161.1 30S ribosomal protein S8 [Thermoproteota archaeon]
MTRLDPLADALSAIKNAEIVNKKTVYIFPANKLIKAVLLILKEHGYIEDFKSMTLNKKEYIIVHLNGKIHEIGAIKPRFSTGWQDLEGWIRKYLPAYTMGLLIVSTPKGLKTHIECVKERIGGKLIAYVY